MVTQGRGVGIPEDPPSGAVLGVLQSDRWTGPKNHGNPRDLEQDPGRWTSKFPPRRAPDYLEGTAPWYSAHMPTADEKGSASGQSESGVVQGWLAAAMCSCL